jgi:hypothetical protein
MKTIDVPIGKRVILTTMGQLSYAGICRGIVKDPAGREAIAVELDPESGFVVLCPVRFVERLQVLALPAEPAGVRGERPTHPG